MNNKIFQVLCVGTILFSLTASGQKLPKLEVSSNHRYLVQDDGTKEGKPFFYLGDTAWELFTRLTNMEVEKYFDVRKSQGFNVIMAISHNELGEKSGTLEGINYPNREGFTPFMDKDHIFMSEGVEEAYWKHVDQLFQQAEKRGIYIAFLPYWGNRYVQKERAHLINTTNQAYLWGYYLGTRYKNQTNIIWVLGGDYEPKDYKTGLLDQDEYDMPIATAEGIADGINGAKKQFDGGAADYTTSLMTYHINVPYSSSKYFHDASFLDFNGMQSGQNVEGAARNYKMVAADYLRNPIKPTIDLEPLYEYGMRKNEKNNKWELPLCSAFDIRRNAYRSVLAGAMGFNYGNNNVWLFYKKNSNYEDRYMQTNDWDSNEGIYADGAKQMISLKNLVASRPFYTCIPTDDLIRNDSKQEIEQSQIVSLLSRDKSFAVSYIPIGQVFNVDLSQVSGNIGCWWYNPVTGNICDQDGMELKFKKPFKEIDQKKKTTSYQFSSPSNQDWVLILDDTSKMLSPPGSAD